MTEFFLFEYVVENRVNKQKEAISIKTEAENRDMVGVVREIDDL